MDCSVKSIDAFKVTDIVDSNKFQYSCDKMKMDDHLFAIVMKQAYSVEITAK